MKITMRKADILGAERVIEEFSSRTKLKMRVKYAIDKNLGKIRKEADLIRKATKFPSDNQINSGDPEYKEFAERRYHLEQKHRGNPSAYMDELSELYKEFPKISKERYDQQREVNEFLEEQITLDLHAIRFSDFPEEIPEGTTLEPLTEIILEPDELKCPHCGKMYDAPVKKEEETEKKE